MKEYAVVARPFYREHRPMLHKIHANDEQEAVNEVFRYLEVKEILDVKLFNEVNWDEESQKNYWNMYK